MKNLSLFAGQHSDDELFEFIVSSFRNTITMWDYFVNWSKVCGNVSDIEVELNILNVLIGKDDIESEVSELIMKYPTIVRAFPILLACRDNSFEILTDSHNFLSTSFDFSIQNPNKGQADHIASFVVQSGLGAILRDRKIKNIVDYVVGVEVGLDSNGRKNRGGSAMEAIVGDQLREISKNCNFEYIEQATNRAIKSKWGIEVEMDRSSRIIDFAIKRGEKLYLIEVKSAPQFFLSDVCPLE